MTIGTTSAAVVAAAVMVVAPSAARPDASEVRRCSTLVSSGWTRTVDGRVTYGRRYRIETERLSCFVVTRLAAQLIPLRTGKAFAAARPPGYVCAALGTAANPYRPATAVGMCLQKPVGSPPPRSFSWRPVG